MSWEALVRAGADLAPSPAEQARFGLSVDRLTVGGGSTAGPARSRRVAELVDGSGADVVVARFPAQAAELSEVLACGPRTCLPAGTIVYWERPVTGEDTRRAAHDLDGDGGDDGLEVVAAADLAPAELAQLPATVASVVRASFAGYGNHYSVDPLMPDELALAGYVEWASGSVAADPQGVLLLHGDDGVVGVATTSRGSDGGTDGGADGPDHLEVLLAGLVPQAQGRGRYGRLLAGVVQQAARDGLGRVVISTQAHNARVQRAWARAGFVPFAAYETVHCVRPGLLTARR